MADEGGGAFKAGDRVLLEGDALGTLARAVGKGKWVVKVEGEKTRVVPEDAFRKCNFKAKAGPDAEAPKQSRAPPRRYAIVGTWDDWDIHDMVWNGELMCFEHVVTMGSDGVESFKFLQDGDWELCIHPGCTNAGPDERAPQGPEDAGLESEWTIGLLPSDQAAEGSCHQVRLFLLTNGHPKSVSWRLLTPADDRDSKIRPAAAEPEATRQARREDIPANTQSTVLEYAPITHAVGGGLHVEALRGDDSKERSQKLAEDMVEMERAARERLVERLDGALAVPDGGSAAQQAEELKFKLARNRRRYENEDDSTALMDPGYAQNPWNAQKPSNTFSTGRRRAQGRCVECGGPTEEAWDFGGHCCESCIRDFQDLTREGWNGETAVNGISAHERAQKLQQEFNWTAQEARIAVMRTFPHMFRPGVLKTAPQKKSVGLQRCAKCSCISFDGQCAADGTWRCPRCWDFRAATLQPH